MHKNISTDAWISRGAVALGLIALASAVGALILTEMSLPVSEILIGLGIVSGAGSARLLISPLNQGWLE